MHRRRSAVTNWQWLTKLLCKSFVIYKLFIYSSEILSKSEFHLFALLISDKVNTLKLCSFTGIHYFY